jgi:hypothetical protein
MSIEDQTDAPLAAVAALVRGAITADLSADMVLAIYDEPRPLQILASGKLPALCIYRKRERRRRRNSVALVSDVTIYFDYLLPATSLEKRSARWPALSVVWNLIADVVIDGKHSAVSSGAAVLDAAGLNVEQENSAQVENDTADGGAQAYPFFRGQIIAAFTPSEVDVATLDDFLRFHMAFDRPGMPSGGDDGVEPIIELDLTLPAYGS